MALQDTDLLPLYRKTDDSNRKISVGDLSTHIGSAGEGFVILEGDDTPQVITGTGGLAT